MGWAESGQAWGERAADWAYLIEPYARRVNDALFDRAGVGPGTRLLDIACGSLRAGCRFVPYLERGNYLGIDIDSGLIKHGRNHELGPTLCEIKQPEFVISSDFEFSRFSKRPDFAIAQSLFTHLTVRDMAGPAAPARPAWSTSRRARASRRRGW